MNTNILGALFVVTLTFGCLLTFEKDFYLQHRIFFHYVIITLIQVKNVITSSIWIKDCDSWN